MFWFVPIASLGTTGRKRGPGYDQYLCGKGTSLDHILFAVATTSRSFPAKLFPSWVAPNKYWCMRFFLPRCSPLKGLLNCRRFCQPISPACRGPSGRQHETLVHQPLLPAWCHLQTYHGFTLPPILSINGNVKQRNTRVTAGMNVFFYL